MRIDPISSLDLIRRRGLIIDLDVHQGNGHERDKLEFHPHDLYIIDVFNPHIYPGVSCVAFTAVLVMFLCIASNR